MNAVVAFRGVEVMSRFWTCVCVLLGMSALVSVASAQSKPLQITVEKSEVHYPTVSPDGNHLVYSARIAGDTRHDLNVVTLTGRMPRKKRVAHGSGATFSPDSARVLYYSEEQRDNRYWITTARVNGRDKRQYEAEGLDPTAALALHSPDGAQILFTNRKGTHVLDVASGQHKRISTKVLTNPTWHPAGGVIAYEKRGGGVVLMDVTTGERRNLVSGHKPRWSPDGSQLLWMHDFTIFTMAIDTGEKRRIGPGADAIWSNAGLALIVLEESGSFTQGASFEVPDLKARWVPLAEGVAAKPLMDKLHGLAVTPDGRFIYAAVHNEGIYRLRLDALDGQDAARKALSTPAAAPSVAPSAAVPDRKPPVKRPDRPIDPDVLKAVQ